MAVRGSGHGRDRERRRFPLRRWSRLARRRVTGAMRAAPRGRHRPAPLRAAPLRPTARSAAPVSGAGVGGGGDAGGGDAGPKDEGRWGGSQATADPGRYGLPAAARRGDGAGPRSFIANERGAICMSPERRAAQPMGGGGAGHAPHEGAARGAMSAQCGAVPPHRVAARPSDGVTPDVTARAAAAPTNSSFLPFRCRTSSRPARPRAAHLEQAEPDCRWLLETRCCKPRCCEPRRRAVGERQNS